MKREEEIRESINKHFPCTNGGRCYEQSLGASGFELGVQWADQHPKSIWHDASEEPICGKRLLILHTNSVVSIFNYTGKTNWSLLASCGIHQYAYISDILPKGGKK